MQQELLAIANRNSLQRIAKRIEGIDTKLRVGIGFLGEFNSGKSTLINALIGQKILPAMGVPTTTSITEVEPRAGLAQFRYLRRNGNDVTEILPLEFNELATGRADGIAVLEVPENTFMRDGFRFVDTPGISSLDDLHRDVTCGYLPMLDGAVLCLDINQGGVTASVHAFLSRPEVRLFSERIIVALTRADLKIAAAAAEAVRADVAHRLGHERVVVVAAGPVLEGRGDLSLFTDCFGKIFVEPGSTLLAARLKKTLAEVANEIIATLRSIRSDLTLDDAALRQREKEIERGMREIEDARENATARLTKFARVLRDSLVREATKHEVAIRSATPEDIDERCDSLTGALGRTSRELLARFEDEIAAPSLGPAAESLRLQISKIIQRVEVGKTLVTEAVIVYLSGGTSLVAEAGEATGGAIMRELIKRAAKSKSESIFGRALSSIGTMLEEVNPINYGGDMLADYWKRSAAARGVVDVAHSVAEQVEAHARQWYIDERFEPLACQLRDRSNALLATREARRSASADVEQQRRDIDKDILTVSSLIQAA